MLKAIFIRDFQSHGNTSIMLHPCFNIITGPSGSGKSAFLRALNALFYNNMAGTSFVRVGSPKAEFYSVAAVAEDNTEVAKRRGSSINEYLSFDNAMVDGSYVYDANHATQRYGNVGTDVPDVVIKSLNIRPIKIDANKEVNIQYCGQFDAPFMLMEPASAKMKFLNALSGTYAVDLAIKESNLLGQKSKKQYEAAEANINKLKLQSDEYGRILSTIETANKYLADKMKEYKELQDQKVVFDGMQDESDNLTTKFKSLHQLQALFDKFDFDDILAKAKKLVSLMELQREYNSLLSKTKTVNEGLAKLRKVDIDKAKVDIECLLSYQELQTAYDALKDSYIKNTTLLRRENEILDKKVEEYGTLLKEIKICPICHSRIDDNMVDHIKESLS